MLDKLNTTMKSGVKGYWIIDTVKKRLYQYGFKDHDIDLYEFYNEVDSFESYCFEELEITLSEIFE